MKTRLAAVALSLAVLAGCQRDAQPPAASAPAAEPAPAPAAPPGHEPQGGTLLNVTPASLPDCSPAVVTVRWDASGAAGVTAIEVHVDGSDGKLFSDGGPVGESATGPWALPGGSFVLLDAATRQELARAVIGGPVCTQ